MPNKNHIDLLLNHTAGDITTDPVQLPGGSVAIFLTAVLEPGAEIKIQNSPEGSNEWYDRPAGIFASGDLDANGKAWVNANLAEGEVRAVLTGATVATTITEFLVRPVIEYQLEM